MKVARSGCGSGNVDCAGCDGMVNVSDGVNFILFFLAGGCGEAAGCCPPSPLSVPVISVSRAADGPDPEVLALIKFALRSSSFWVDSELPGERESFPFVTRSVNCAISLHLSSFETKY